MDIKKVDNKRQVLFLFIIMFLIMLLFNTLSPFCYDDYSNSVNSVTGEKVTSIKDIYESVVVFYKTWGGRVFGDMFAHAAFLFPKVVYNIISSFAYIFFIFLIARHVDPFEELKASLVLYVMLLSWLCIIFFGDVFLWMAGTVNYLFTVDIVLAYLLVYRKNINTDSTFRCVCKCIGIFILGIAAGWCNENTAAAVPVMVIAFWFYYKYIAKEKIQSWFYVGFVGVCIGSALLVLAPGVRVRIDVYTLNSFESKNWFCKYLYRFGVVTVLSLLWISPLLIVYPLLLSKAKIKKSYFLASPVLVYCIGAFVSTYCLILSPAVSRRSFLIVDVFLFVILLLLLKEAKVDVKATKYYRIIFKVAVVLAVVSCLFSTFGNIRNYIDHKEMEAFILAQKENGITDIIVEVPRTLVGDIHKAQMYIPEMAEDPATWYNLIEAKYHYNIDSIIGVKHK